MEYILPLQHRWRFSSKLIKDVLYSQMDMEQQYTISAPEFMADGNIGIDPEELKDSPKPYSWMGGAESLLLWRS
ncbi:hypothetical protein H8959_008604 [Pygathrix nigripes]